jgi:hypothetical protein
MRRPHDGVVSLAAQLTIAYGAAAAGLPVANGVVGRKPSRAQKESYGNARQSPPTPGLKLAGVQNSVGLAYATGHGIERLEKGPSIVASPFDIRIA